MLNHSCSFAPAADLLALDSTLAVMPLTSVCAPSELGVVQAGVAYAGLCGAGVDMTIDISTPNAIPHEVWSVKDPVTRGHKGPCQWSHTDSLICVAHWLSADDCAQIERATCEAYTAIFEVLREHDFPHVFRAWHYLPNINQGDGDNEVYKQFCSGRLRAFEHVGIAPSRFPAASALGHHAQGAVIYVMASRIRPQHFNNNRQVNAYEYPRQYGISSPSFARATAIRFGDSSHVFISGTASIIGHRTVELGKLFGQLRVTADNIAHLLTTANPDTKTLSTFKVYVRHREHITMVQDWLTEHYPQVLSIITLADICRDDLLVEIEGFCE